MSDYMTAYRDRLIRNEKDLIDLIHAVREKNPSIEAYVHDEEGNRLITGVTFFKEDLINRIGFHEVPYRWSGCGYTEHGRSHPGKENVAMPFSADDVIANFHALEANKRYNNKESYLKWYSFLNLYTQ